MCSKTMAIPDELDLDFLTDLSFFEEDLFLLENGADFLAPKQKLLWHDLTLDDILRSLDDGLGGQLEPPISPLDEPDHDATKTGGSKASLKPKRKVKGWRNTPEGIKHRAIAKERQRIKNREAAARSHANKKKYVKDLELQYRNMSRENALRKRVLKFLEISMEVGTLPKKLERTTSGPMPSY